MLAVVPQPGLLFGLMLAAAILGGYLARLARVPRVVGYILAGVALAWVLRWAVGAPQDSDAEARLADAAAPLSAVRDLALGIILFTIGNVFEKTRLRATGGRVLKLALVEAALVLVICFTACFAASVLFQGEIAWGSAALLAALLALSAIETAPGATLFVLQEYEAKGPVTNTILGLIGANNILCIVLFFTTFLLLARFGIIETTELMAANTGWALAAETAGSVAVGVLAGLVLTLIHAKLPTGESVLIFFALFIILGAGEKWLLENRGASYNFLLTSLIIGAIFANVAPDARKLDNLLRTVGTPIFVGFFVLAGFKLHVEELAQLGAVGAAYVLARLTGKCLAAVIGRRWLGVPAPSGLELGGAMLCHAALVIGLVSFAERYWISPLSEQYATVILGSVVMFELIGPLLVKRCVVRAGEVKAVSLLSRRQWSESGSSGVQVILESLARLVGIRPKSGATPIDQMRVRHVMRTNVDILREGDSFGDVLHFIERSTYAHFPVVHGDGTFAGVIHFRDVRDVIYDPVLASLLTAVDLADQSAAFVPMDLPVTELMETFRRFNVSVLPVVESRTNPRVIGLVEQRDVLRVVHTEGTPTVPAKS